MKVSLVVVRAFDVHAPGDQLEEADAIARVLGGEHADYVVRVQQPDAPAARED